MNAIHLRKHVDSDLAEFIPELSEVVGQEVDIFIVPQLASGNSSVETLETFLGESAHRAPPDAEEMVELRALAEKEPAVAAALRMAERGGLDVETILAIRNAD